MSSLFLRSFQLVKNINLVNGAPLILAKHLSSMTNSKNRKRFYKDVTICESYPKVNNQKLFEINLDKRKLKTPGGKLVQIDNEHLAHAISQEWSSQTDSIKLNTMHLTSLYNTCMDNPNKLTKDSLAKSLCEYLQTDTLLYFDSDSKQKLDHLQETKWRPLVDWFNQKFPDLKLSIQKDIIDTESMNSSRLGDNQNSFEQYLNKNFDLNTLIAFNYMCECLKSVILSVALLERKVESVEEACSLANLEQAFQFEQWGKVEWYHDINEHELKARVSASLLFIYLSNSSKYLVVKKTKQI